jgi:hypothetical protein
MFDIFAGLLSTNVDALFVLVFVPLLCAAGMAQKAAIRCGGGMRCLVDLAAGYAVDRAPN